MHQNLGSQSVTERTTTQQFSVYHPITCHATFGEKKEKRLSVSVNRIFVLPGPKSENPFILNAFGPLQIASIVSKAYISSPLQFFVCEPDLSRGHECVLCFRKDLKQLPLKLMLLIFPHRFLFSLSLCLRLISLPLCVSLHLYQSLSPSLVMLMIWCAGRGGTCARLTWDDTNRFITMGSPEDQKTHLKGEFQSINCLTWLTQVWETFRMAIKGPAERQNRVVVGQGGWLEYFSLCNKRWGISHKITCWE